MISESDAAFYHENGYLVVEDVLSPDELAAVLAATDELVAKASGVVNNDALYDLEDTHTPEAPRVRRLKSPDAHHATFRRLAAHPNVVSILERLWGVGVRYDKAKLNMKSESGGSAVEWHQDWAFYPHTNDDLAAVGFMLDDMTPENGPLLVLPGSHRGPTHDHFADGAFCGAIDVAHGDLDTSSAAELTGRAGSITVHHVRAVHGSRANVSGRPRRLLLHQYTAADAWPLLGVPDYEVFRASLLSGEESKVPRIRDVPVVMPFPKARHEGSIYENQRTLSNRFFAHDAARRSAAT